MLNKLGKIGEKSQFEAQLSKNGSFLPAVP